MAWQADQHGYTSPPPAALAATAGTAEDAQQGKQRGLQSSSSLISAIFICAFSSPIFNGLFP